MFDNHPIDYLMTQCLLRRDTFERVAYIPSIFAKPNAALAIEGEQWTVTEIYTESEKPYNKLNSREHRFIKDNWSNI